METKQVDAIIEKHQTEKGPLISILHDIQDQEGYLPEQSLRYLSERLRTPLSEVFRVAAYFEKAFSFRPKGKHTVRVCQGTTCYLKHSDQTWEEIEEAIAKDVDAYKDSDFHLEKVRCLGCCTVAPAVEIDGEIHDKDSAKTTIIKLKGEKGNENK